jgi:dienelactone hydrolase
MEHLSDWPAAWISVSDQARLDRDLRAEVSALEWSRLTLDREDPLHETVAARLRARYLEREDVSNVLPVIHRHAGVDVPLLLQAPDGPPPADGWPVLVVQTGIGESKERYHRLAQTALGNDIACLRVDMPDLPATEYPGISTLDDSLVDLLAADHRFDARQIHLFGSCIGGGLVLGAASNRAVASVTAVSAWYDYVPRNQSLVPEWILEYLSGGMQPTRDSHGRIVEMPVEFSLRGMCARISCPVTLHHGALDVISPMRESLRIAEEIGDERATCTTWSLQGHGCVGKRPQIELELLSRIEDTRQQLRRGDDAPNPRSDDAIAA